MTTWKEVAVDAAEETAAPPRGSRTLEMLGITNDDLVLMDGDAVLSETLRSTHDLLHALKRDHVLDTFLQLPMIDRSNFLNWIASSTDRDVRRSRTRSFVSALRSSPLSSKTRENRAIAVTEPSSAELEQPTRIGVDRDQIADDRDAAADAHDEASRARDEKAQARDERAEGRERELDQIDAGAAADRAGALRDRRAAVTDRREAGDDRAAAAADREVSAREREVSSIDELTGAYRRDAGTLALERELSKAKRMDRSLVVAFVDVDDLKQTNDSLGHAAGDLRLRETVRAMRKRLRSYDLIVRFGGDEFVCGMPEASFSTAVQRFAAVNTVMGRAGHGSITVGLAEMGSGDTLEGLIARADEALYLQRDRALSLQTPD